MYAVMKTGGKQYRVEPNDRLRVDKLVGEPGTTVDIGDVLMVGDGENTQVGAPLLAGASVKLEVVEQTRNDKIVVFKKKRRQNYRRKQGHRQEMTVVRVAEIADAHGKKATAADAAPKPKAKSKKAAATDAAASDEE
ncbi:MAG: 50S ribosomal protein L21 [Alphaproteobacteria bacterium]|jgi:large subunit ribosomal protein L21